MNSPCLILASASERRRTLLQQAGYAFLVIDPRAEEPPTASFPDAEAYAQYTAWRKARSIALRLGIAAVVLAADTVVSLENAIIGKAGDRTAASTILKQLSGTNHEVISGVCLYAVPQNHWLGFCSRSTVHMRRISDIELSAYLDSGQWQGKAGAYGIQDQDPYVSIIQGTYSNVVGLPVEQVMPLLRNWGIYPSS